MAAKRPRRGVLGANDITGVAYFECPAILDFRLVRGRLEVPRVAKWARRGALGAYSSTGNAYFECSAVLYSWPVGWVGVQMGSSRWLWRSLWLPSDRDALRLEHIAALGMLVLSARHF